jgi:hypothetical protein
MPGSKSSKKCAYIYKQGKKSGKKCGKNCLKKFCKEHNQRRQQYSSKYNEKLKEERKANKVENVFTKIAATEKISNLPNENDLRFKIHRLIDEGAYLLKQVAGVKIFLGEDPDDVINQTFNAIYGRCQCKQMFENGEIKEESMYGLFSCRNCSQKEYDATVKFIEYKDSKSNKVANERLTFLRKKGKELASKIGLTKKILDAVVKQKEKLSKK